MTHGKWLDDLPVRFGSWCLRPTGVTQPPLVDYIFPLMDCLLIHMFVDHFHGAKQCSNEFLCAKAKPSDLFTRMTELQTNVQIWQVIYAKAKGKKRKEWYPWTWDKGVSVKVLLKFDPSAFPEHFRPAEELFPFREKLPFANKSSEADAPQVNPCPHQDLLLLLLITSTSVAKIISSWTYQGNAVFSLREKNRLFTERLGRTWVICTGNPSEDVFAWILEACWMEDRIRR